MAYNYILLAAAQAEYESSIIWYNERSWLAADEFAEAVENAIKLICDHPYRWRNEHGKFHELALKNFPYSIVYGIDVNRELVVIGSIYHHRRNPKKKYRK